MSNGINYNIYIVLKLGSKPGVGIGNVIFRKTSY